MYSHLLLMQEEVSYESLVAILNYMIKTLVDADCFSFFIKREKQWEVIDLNTIVDVHFKK
jgi:cAMP-specific phosphodiesterase 4